MRNWIRKLAGLVAIVLGSPLSALDVSAVEYQDVTTIIFPTGSISVYVDKKSNSLVFSVPGVEALNLDQMEFESSRFMWVKRGVDSGPTAQLLCDCTVWVKSGANGLTVKIMNAAVRAMKHGEYGFSNEFASGGYSAMSGPFRFPRSFGDAKSAKTASGLRTGPLPEDLPTTYGDQQPDFVAQRMLRSLEPDEQGFDAVGLLKPTPTQENISQIVIRGDILQQSRAMPEVEEGAAALVSGCTDFRNASPQEWPETHDALSVLATARNAIARESGDLDASAAETLVKAYLSLGMGVEASQYLAFANFSNTELTIYKAISNAIDGQKGDFNFAIGQVDICPSAAIWAVLEGSTSEMSALDLARVQFAQAPEGVQAAIGARLAARYLESDERDAAAFVLKTIKSLPEQQTGERGLIVSQLEKSEGYMERSAKVLEEITQSDADVAPDALLEMVMNALEDGEAIADQDENLLRTYRAERQGTDLEKDLMRAELQARTNRGDYASVVNMLPDFERIARPSQVDLAIDDLAGAVLKDQSDAVFLTTILDLPTAYLRRVSDSQRREIDQRFAALGLQKLARDLESEHRSSKAAGETNGDAAKPMMDPGTESAGSSKGRDEHLSRPDKQNASDVIQQTSSELSASQDTNVRKTQYETIQKPITKAVARSTAVLDTMTDLKAQIADAGLK